MITDLVIAAALFGAGMALVLLGLLGLYLRLDRIARRPLIEVNEVNKGDEHGS